MLQYQMDILSKGASYVITVQWGSIGWEHTEEFSGYVNYHIHDSTGDSICTESFPDIDEWEESLEDELQQITDTVLQPIREESPIEEEVQERLGNMKIMRHNTTRRG